MQPGTSTTECFPTRTQGCIDLLPDEFYLDRLSTVSRSRKPSPIWDLFSVEYQPGMLSMLAGKPNPATFPFEHITLGIKSPFHPADDVATTTTTELVLRGEDLSTALQYGMTAGIPDLVDWIQGLMQEVHLPSSPSPMRQSGSEEGWRVSLGPGSQDLLYKAFCALLNPGDTIIVEGPTYPTIIPLLDAMGCHYAIVDSDEEGMCASTLDNILRTWGTSQTTKERSFPKVLYTVPFGSNPAGITTGHKRRIEILQLARCYDLIIIEDDPYYFLYYGDGPRPPSYFSLDRKSQEDPVSAPLGGRVLRLDSFSKIISAGFRLGWITGPPVLLTAIERHNASTVVQPSSLSQMVVLKLLQTWGMSGFLAHTERTAAFYKQRRDVMVGCLERYLGKNSTITPRALAEWKVPDASMFFWVKLNIPCAPLAEISATSKLGAGQCSSSTQSELVADSTVFVRDSAVPSGVLVLPGATAFPDGRRTECVRLSFSLLSDEEMEEAARRLRDVIVAEGVGGQEEKRLDHGGVGVDEVKLPVGKSDDVQESRRPAKSYEDAETVEEGRKTDQAEAELTPNTKVEMKKHHTLFKKRLSIASLTGLFGLAKRRSTRMSTIRKSWSENSGSGSSGTLTQ